VRYSFRDILTLAGSPGGRLRILEGANQKAWPLLYPIASFHRRTLARRCRVVSVVGTFGKTTTQRAVSAALGLDASRAGQGNSWSLLAEAILAVQPEDRYAVIEVGISGTGQMARYARMIRPDITVVTSIGSEHHRSLRSPLATRAEKSLMLSALPSSGLAVLNGDDPHVLWMAGRTKARTVTYGFGASNDVRASEAALDWPRGTHLRLHAHGRTRELRVRVLGPHMVRCILAAVAVALAEGLALGQIVPRLERLTPTPGRLEPVPLGNGAFLLRDDFKSAEETIASALDVLAEIPARRRIVVLGEVSEPVGSQEVLYRRLGERAARAASAIVFVTGRKNFQRYSAGATRAGMRREALVHAGRSVLAAAEALKGEIGPGDVVLVKGRSDQRLDRVAFALQGRPVRCDVNLCRYEEIACDRCPMLERGWDGLRVVT